MNQPPRSSRSPGARGAVPERDPLEPFHDPEYVELRRLILGPERALLHSLRGRIESPQNRAADLAAILPAVLEDSALHDDKLRAALQPVVEHSLTLWAQRDPRRFARALLPLFGTALRKWITTALQSRTSSITRSWERSWLGKGIGWRIDADRSHRSIGQLALERSTLYRVELALLMDQATGSILAQESIVNARSALPSPLPLNLTLQDLDHGAPIQVVPVGRAALWILRGQISQLACVVHGSPPDEWPAFLRQTLERIEAAATAGEIAKLVRGCLLGRGTVDLRRSLLPWVGAAMLLALAGIVGTLGWWWYDDGQRWNEYLRRLAHEPGIVVTHGERHVLPPRHVLYGLRDPFAPDPADLIPGTGIRPESVETHWAPFHSLEPAFVAARLYEERRERLANFALSFEAGRADAAPGSLETLAGDIRALLAAARRAGRPVAVEVHGFGDQPGPPGVPLARTRAFAVVRELARRGIAPSLLRAVADGVDPEAIHSRTVMFRAYRP